MFFRKIFFFILLFSLFFPALATLAAGDVNSKVPEFNPLCWKWTDDGLEKGVGGCRGARLKYLSDDASESELKSGWIQSKDVCGSDGKWGLCLPAGKTKTSISFAGKAEFLHVGDYILTVYKYSLGIASILAVIMIIAAGIQWLTSGGNSDGITKAKTRITGAFIGLFILFSSYFILNAINPALINLRLPQTYMIKPAQLVPLFCSLAPSTTEFAYGGDYKDQTSKLTKPGIYDLKYKDYLDVGVKDEKIKAKFYCGHRFFMKDAGESTCFGSYCPKANNKPYVCGEFGTDPKKYICKQATLAGRIIYSPVSFNPICPNNWETNEIADSNEQELWIVCSDRRTEEVSSQPDTNNSEKEQFFTLSATDEDIDGAITKCGGESKTAGFVIKLEMNRQCSISDQDHFFDKDGNDLGAWLTPNNSNLDSYSKEKLGTISFFKLGVGLLEGEKDKVGDKTKITNLIPVKSIKSGYEMPTINAEKVSNY